jgi:enediyne biosynthesis thioesterase
MFLRDHAREVLDGLKGDFALVTTRVSCEYLAELSAFDELVISMGLGEMKQNRITMLFEYWRTLPKAKSWLHAASSRWFACSGRESGCLRSCSP